jgi:heme exporter protein C
VGALGVGLLAVGSALGLGWAPAERYMGDVGRILYVHVPAAWVSLLCFVLAGGLGIASLATGSRRIDAAVVAACEVGSVMGALLLALGAVFAKPTWGAWWTWDSRAITTAVLALSNVAVLALRALLLDPRRRATATATGAVVAALNVPLVYASVWLFPSIHAVPTFSPSGSPIDPTMRSVLLLNAGALALVTGWFLVTRWRIERSR